MHIRFDSRRRDLLEVISAYVLILAVIWTPPPLHRVLYLLAILLILGMTILHRDHLYSLGLGRGSAARALWIVAAAFVLSALAVTAARRLGTLHTLPRVGYLPVRTRVVGYLIWSFVQEFLMQIFFLTRLMHLLPRRWLAIAAAALLFASLHIPNPVLVWLTLLWAFIACPLFLRYRNLYAIGLAHGILGLCVAVTIPDALHHHMRVGLGYLRYQPRVSGAALPTSYPHRHV